MDDPKLLRRQRGWAKRLLHAAIWKTEITQKTLYFVIASALEIDVTAVNLDEFTIEQCDLTAYTIRRFYSKLSK